MSTNGVDLRDSIENEHFCLKLLKEFHLPVAESAIHRFGNMKTLVVKRFDRHWRADGTLLRLPQEDCCQALGYPSTRKYQNQGGPGIADIAKLLKNSSSSATDRKNFFKVNILFWLIGAIDGHAKNFSIRLGPRGLFELTPFYDVLSVQPLLAQGGFSRKDLKLAMSIGTRNYYQIEKILARHFIQTGLNIGFTKNDVTKKFQEIDACFESAFERACEAMPADFPCYIPKAIYQGMKTRLAKLGRSSCNH